MKMFGSKKKDFAKVIDESDALGEVTIDCPAVMELKQDNELNKELNLKIDDDFYTLDDLFLFLNLSKTKITECKVKVKKVDDSTAHIIFNGGKLVLKSDFTFDWEI
jgi:hypothetical protein|tara:strand:+ start:413 stop:730 length:318 start_codon:yes stop_codon:yes gene_type:complete